jgi:putative flippase GtrA
MNFRQVLGQIFRFAGVGLANSVLYFILAATLNGLFGLGAVLASAIAYILAAVVSFQGHKRLTFQTSGRTPTELPKFIAATIMGVSLATVIPVISHSYAPVVSFLAVLFVVPICSFIMMKFFVFRA